MKKRALFLIAVLFFIGCSKDEMNSSIETNLMGDWVVVDNNNQSFIVEWGIFYVASVKFYSDKTFKINWGSAADDSSARSGTWLLDHSKDSITFFTAVQDLNTIYRDTTTFNISIDTAGRPILKNQWNTFTHVKRDN